MYGLLLVFQPYMYFDIVLGSTCVFLFAMYLLHCYVHARLGWADVRLLVYERALWTIKYRLHHYAHARLLQTDARAVAHVTLDWLCSVHHVTGIDHVTGSFDSFAPVQCVPPHAILCTPLPATCECKFIWLQLLFILVPYQSTNTPEEAIFSRRKA